MDFEEAVVLSEAEDLKLNPPNTLAKVKTSMFVLTFTGKKSALNAIMASLPPEGHVYWRHNKVGGKDVHRVLLKDATAATFARMFGNDNPVASLSVGDLAEARNEIDVPWLPANRGFLVDRTHDAHVRKARGAVQSALWMLSTELRHDVRKMLEQLSEDFRVMLRRPWPHER